MPNTNGDLAEDCTNCSFEIATTVAGLFTLNDGIHVITQVLIETGPSPLTMWLQLGEQPSPITCPAFPGLTSKANSSVVFTRGISAVDTIT